MEDGDQFGVKPMDVFQKHFAHFFLQHLRIKTLNKLCIITNTSNGIITLFNVNVHIQEAVLEDAA